MWVRSEWRSTWRSLLGVALLIAFTAGSAMAAVAGAQRAEVALDRFLSDIRQSEVTIYTPGALDPAVSALIADDSRIDGTATVAVVAAGPEPLVPGAEAIVVSAPDSYWGGLHRPRLIDGRAPSGPAEVAMTEFSMEHNGLAIGDVIDLRLLRLDELLRCSASGDCDLAELAPVTITGVVRTVDDLAPSPFEHSLFFARSDWLDANGGPAIATGFTTELHLAPGASVEEVIGTYASRIDDGDVTSTRNFLDGPLLAGDLQHDVLLIAALAVGATGLVVCSLAMSRLLGRTSGDGETLTALGMQRAERTVAGSLVASLSAVLGSVLAVGVAASLSPLFPLGSMRRADPGVGFHAPTGAVAVGGLLTLIVTGGIGVGVSARWSRRAGPDRDQRPLSAAAQATERLRLPAVPSMGSRFALERGTATHRTPALAALTASVIGIAALVGALVVVQSLDGLLATGARYGATWDLQVALGDRAAETGETALGSTVVDEVADDPRIAGSAVASVGELDVASGDRRLSQVYTVGFETRSGGLAPVLLEGRGIQGPDEVLLGSNSMADLGVDLGDRVAVAGPSGQASMLVVGRALIPILGSAQADDGAVVSLEVFDEQGATDTVAEVDATSLLLLDTVDAEAARAVSAALRDDGVLVAGASRPSSVSVLDDLRSVPLLFGAFAAVLAALSGLHSLLMTGRRRRRDLAVLRAIGARARDVRGVVVWQSLVVAMVGLGLGIPLGLIGGRAVWRAIAERTRVIVVGEIPWPVVALVLAAGVVVALALAAWPAWGVARRRPAEDLRAE